MNAGEDALFSVEAAGKDALSYCWYFNETNRLAGDANASLTIRNSQRTNAGDYWVVVSDSIGSVTSAVARLTVTETQSR